MVDKGPLLTSAIIFYLSIGAAIFQVLEEPNWKLAVKQYRSQKDQILEAYPCLTKGDLDRILEVSRCRSLVASVGGVGWLDGWLVGGSSVFRGDDNEA